MDANHNRPISNAGSKVDKSEPDIDSNSNNNYPISLPFDSDGLLSLQSHLKDINYVQYQQHYLNEGINPDKSAPEFDSSDLKEVRQQYINVLETEHGYSLTSQLLANFVIRNLVYHGVHNPTKQKVIIKISSDEGNPHRMLNEWYYLSGLNVISGHHTPNVSLDGNRFKHPKTLSRDIPGVLYPTEGFTIDIKNSTLKLGARHILIYPDNDYVPIKDYYKSCSLYSQIHRPNQIDTLDGAHSMTSSNSFSSMRHNSFSNSYVNRDNFTLGSASGIGTGSSTAAGGSTASWNTHFHPGPLSNSRSYNDDNSNSVNRNRESLKTPLEVISILNDVIRILKALRHIHNMGIVHNGLRLSSIIKSKTQSDDTRIAGFEYSFSIQPEDCSNASRRPYLEKTPEFLAYLAPEAIGDVHKGSDFRTDFYSIGIILYELLVGRLPFPTNNPSRLIRMQALHKPVAPNVIAPWINESLNSVIMRLLEKNPWKRYPDCLSLINDLIDIKNGYIEEINEGRSNPFNSDPDSDIKLTIEAQLEKETEDKPSFVMPQRMFGRQKEYEFCSNIFNSNVDGINVILIQGPSGGGKTTMLHDLEDMAISKQEFYGYWKYNESDKQSTLYGAFFHGLSCCVKQILTSTKENIEKWRHTIISSIPVDLNILMQLIPEFKTLIGPKYSTILNDIKVQNGSKPQGIDHQDSLNEQTFNLELRIRYLIKSLYGLFATNGVSLFLDDLQFCTANEWRMAAEIFDYCNSGDLKNKLSMKLFCSYDTTGETFSKPEIVAFMKSFNVTVSELTLYPIKLPDFIQFWKHCVFSGDIDYDLDTKEPELPTSFGAMKGSAPNSASSLNLKTLDDVSSGPTDTDSTTFLDERVVETAKKLWDLSGGNILNTKMIVRTLYWHGRANYSSDRGKVKGSWHLDFGDIAFSRDMDSLISQFYALCLPPECMELLKFASLLAAPEFSLMDLTIVTNLPMKRVFELLTICVESRALIPCSTLYKMPFHLFGSDKVPFDITQDRINDLASSATFLFFHNSTKTFMLEELKAKDELQKFHRLCGLNFYKTLNLEQISIPKFLTMARHFNNSASIARDEDRKSYFKVLIEAGKFALGTYNLNDSLSYFESAQKLIDKHDTAATSKILLTITQIHYFLENFDTCLRLIGEAIDAFGYHENTFLVTKIRCLSNLKRYDETLQVAIEGLSRLGIEISSDYKECLAICYKYQNKSPLSISEIRGLKTSPTVTDKNIILAFEIMSDIIQPTYYSDKEYIKDALVYQMIVMMFKHGTTAFCAVPLMYLANSLAKSADRSKFLRATEYVRISMFLIDSDERLTFSYIQTIYEIYLSTIACYMEPMKDLLKYYEIFISSTRTFFRSGINARDMITGLAKLHLLYLTGHPLDEIYATIVRQDHEYYAVINKTFRDLQFTGIQLLHGELGLDTFESKFDVSVKSPDYLFAYNFFRIWYLNCLERYDEIIDIVVNEVLKIDSIIPNTLLHADFYFALALALSSKSLQIPEELRKSLETKVVNLFTLWDEVCPTNFHSKNLIVRATLNQHNNLSELDRLDMFEEAIETAKLNGSWYDAAWGNSLCANWLLKVNKQSKRITYFAKNALALFKSLDMMLNHNHLKKKYSDYLKDYNWAGIDALSIAGDGGSSRGGAMAASRGDLSVPATPAGTEHGRSTPTSPRLVSPNPLNRKLNHFFSSGIQSSNSRKEKLLGESFTPQREVSNQDFLSRDSLDLNEAVKACLEISATSKADDILMKLLESAIMFTDVDYGVVVMKRQDEPFIQTIGSPNSIYSLSNEPLSSRTDLCPFSLLLYVFQTGEIFNKDEDEVLFQSRFMKDDYYQNNECFYMICIPLRNSNGIAGAIYLESQRPRPALSPGSLFLNEKKRDLIDLLCSQATVSLAKIELYSEMEHAKRVAEDATAEKASFLANMSHEIRTPFNSLLSCSLFLLDTDLNKTQREYVETIRSSAMVTLNIIDGILAFSKIEHGSFTLTNDPFSLIESIENAIQLVGEQAAINDLELVFRNRCPNIKNIFGDETRFRQIVINLVGNAVKFTSEGHILVEVSSKAIIGNRHEITISVEDTGIGIPNDSSHKVFGAFSQVDSSSRRIYGGSGLGLAISKKLADLMGGTLTFDSIEGKGSTFYFVVNAEVEICEEPEIKFDNQKAKELGTTNHTLIIDSHKYTGVSLKENLEWFGMTVSIIEKVSDFNTEKYLDLNSIIVHYDQFEEFVSIRDQVDPKIRVILISQFGKSLPKEIDDTNIFSILLVPFQRPKITELIRNLKNSHGNIQDKKLEKVDNTHFAIKYPLRILIAEDNLINLKVALQHLKKLGYIADHAKDGVEVIDRCLVLLDKEEHYDVIFMDIQMPRKDGITTAIELKELFEGDGKQNYLPEIVALTANVAGEDRQRSLACGMIDFVSKPILPHNLKAVLQKIGERRIDSH